MNNAPKTFIDMQIEALAKQHKVSVDKAKEAFIPKVGETFVIGTFVYRIVATRTNPMKIHAVPIAVYEAPKKKGWLEKAKSILKPHKV